MFLIAAARNRSRINSKCEDIASSVSWRSLVLKVVSVKEIKMNRSEEKAVSEKRRTPVVEIKDMADALEGCSKDVTRKPVHWTVEFAASGNGKGGNPPPSSP